MAALNVERTIELLNYRGISLNFFSESIGRSREYVEGVLSGKVEANDGDIERIAAVLCMSVEYITEEEKDSEFFTDLPRIEQLKFESFRLRKNREVLLLRQDIWRAEKVFRDYKDASEKEKDYLWRIIDLSEKTIQNSVSGHQNKFFSLSSSIYADLKTEYLEKYASSLCYGDNTQREHKMTTIREIRAWAKAEIEKHKVASYQLQYLLALYPGLQDVLDMDYADLQFEKGKIPEHDYTRDYLSKEEWDSLSVSDRNQLALDRYVESNSKTKWQIGRDYEMYIGYTYEQDGWSVQYTGVELGYEDLGRDLVAVRGDDTHIVQCKYWGESKVIHEKHIMQLYGTMVAYRIQNPSKDPRNIKGIFVTNITLSDTASKFAQLLDIVVRENIPKGEFPRIKCNIGKDEYGANTYIYHLPMDLNYDSVKLDKPGECLVFTVREAEEKGFRRAFKWTGL